MKFLEITMFEKKEVTELNVNKIITTTEYQDRKTGLKYTQFQCDNHVVINALGSKKEVLNNIVVRFEQS